MIIGKINDTEINIPTSWGDVPYKSYIAFTKVNKPIEQVSVLTGISIEQLERLNAESLGAILMAMSFTVEQPNAYLEGASPIDIGRESYGKIEGAKALLQSTETPLDVIIPIMKLYTGVDYSDMPTDIVHPIGAFFLLSCLSSLNDIKD